MDGAIVTFNALYDCYVFFEGSIHGQFVYKGRLPLEEPADTHTAVLNFIGTIGHPKKVEIL